MDDCDWQLDLEMLAGGRKGKPGIDRKLPWVDQLERAGNLDVQKVADAKEASYAAQLGTAITNTLTLYRRMYLLGLFSSK